MKSTLRSLAAALLLCSPFAQAASPQVTLSGAQFSTPPFNNEQSMRPFNSQKPVALALLLRSSSAILDVDRDKSLDGMRLTDARGKRVQVEVSLWPFQKKSKDQQAAIVNVRLNALPPANAGVMHLKGTLHFKMALRRKQAQTGLRTFKVGDSVKLDGIAMKVGDIGKPKWNAGRYPLQVTLKGDGAMDRLADVKFFDAGGKEIESKRGSRSRLGFAGHVQVEVSYRLKRKVSKMRIQVQYWDGIQERSAPFDVTVRRPF